MSAPQKLRVVKIGGNVIDDPASLSRFVADFAALPSPKILVHGGGKAATALAGRLGVATAMIGGRRVTSPEMLDVAVMVYAGLINKRLAASLNARGCRAMGLSGADAMSIVSHKRSPEPVDYGMAGDVDSVDGRLLATLAGAGITPVFCAVTCSPDGQLLNTNADTVAMEVAAAAAAQGFDTELTYCFEMEGVMRNVADPGSVIGLVTAETAPELIDSGVIAGGMLPKVTNALKGVTDRGIGCVVIKNAARLADDGAGTKIKR